MTARAAIAVVGAVARARVAGDEGPQGEDQDLVVEGEAAPSQRAGARGRLPRHARRGLRLPAHRRVPAEQGRLVRAGATRPSARAAQGRSHHRQSAGRPSATRRTRRCSRCTPSTVCRPMPPRSVRASRTSRRCSPTRSCTSRTPRRPVQHDGPDHRPHLADRQGPARHHRVAAEGGQDVRGEDDRPFDRAQQPRGAS